MTDNGQLTLFAVTDSCGSDDAWNPGDVSPFAVGGRVRTLLTTRELDVARYLDSVVIEVDPFTPQQCLDMFSLALASRFRWSVPLARPQEGFCRGRT